MATAPDSPPSGRWQRTLWLSLVALPLLAGIPPAQAAVWLGLAWGGTWLGPRFPHLTGPLARALLTLGLVGGLLWCHPDLLDPAAGRSLLLIVTALKLLETERPRDGRVLATLATLLAGLALWQLPPPLAWPYLPPASLALLMLWLQPGQGTRGPGQRQALALGLPAGTLAAALFVLLPAQPGPLWPPAGSAGRGRTGFAETLEPGRFSQLARTPGTAFRVWFEGPVPAPERRYWRVLVLEYSDGRRWWPAPPLPAGRPGEPPREGRYRYRIRLGEAGDGGHWLPALDRPLLAPPGTRRLPALGLRRLDQRRSYRLVSGDPAAPARLSPERRRRDTRVPARLGPRSRALARRLHRQHPATADFVRALLAFFRDGGFRYSLNPPPLGPRPIDELLFSTRRGFCAHYASAFSLLARAAGIPARVVSGYQGGVPDGGPAGLRVRQADAHAWSEIWFPQRGWQRVDPTAVVAPERIRRPVAGTGPAPLFSRLLAGLYGRLRDGWRGPWSGGPQSGQAPRPSWLGLLFAGSLLTGTLLWLRRQRRRGSQRPDRARRLYRRACRRLAARGLRRHATEGPLAFARRVARHPGLPGDRFLRLTEIYVRIRYGGEASAALLHRLAWETAALKRATSRYRTG